MSHNTYFSQQLTWLQFESVSKQTNKVSTNYAELSSKSLCIRQNNRGLGQQNQAGHCDLSLIKHIKKNIKKVTFSKAHKGDFYHVVIANKM